MSTNKGSYENPYTYDEYELLLLNDEWEGGFVRFPDGIKYSTGTADVKALPVTTAAARIQARIRVQIITVQTNLGLTQPTLKLPDSRATAQTPIPAGAAEAQAVSTPAAESQAAEAPAQAIPAGTDIPIFPMYYPQTSLKGTGKAIQKAASTGVKTC